MLTWTILVLGLAAAVVVAVVVLAILAKRSPADSDRPFVLVVTRFLALIWGGITAVATIIHVAMALLGDVVRVTIPVTPFWPEPYPWITISDPIPAAVVGGGFARADLDVTGLGLDARLWLAGGHLVTGATVVLLALVVALVSHRMLERSPFQPVVARALMISAGTVALGGMAAQLCFGMGGSLASFQVLSRTGWSAQLPTEEIADYLFDHLEGTGLPEAGLSISLDFWPVMVGLALAAVSIAFRHGSRLQHDTEGLV